MLFSFEPRMDERKRYFDRFELGVEAYLNGEWEQARALLEGCVNSDPGDRPPAVLLESWSNHRTLKLRHWVSFAQHGTASLGRFVDHNDVVIPDHSVSGEHALIDTGTARENSRDAFRRALENAGIEPGAVTHLLATHHHPDHFGASGGLAEDDVRDACSIAEKHARYDRFKAINDGLGVDRSRCLGICGQLGSLSLEPDEHDRPLRCCFGQTDA